MRIVLASSEAVPFSKTGGLGDVATALSKALDRIGHDITLMVPFYPSILPSTGPDVSSMGRKVTIPVGSVRVTGDLLSTRLPDSNVDVVFIHQPELFDRDGLYRANGVDYPDNCARFVFFSRAVMEATRQLDLRPDILHANDWQTGLIPALVSIEYSQERGFEQTGSVFTIHNLAFQGNFWHWDMALTGLDWKYFNWSQMEFFGQLSLLKTGVVFSDMVTTVSPTYASEIQRPELGCGMDGVLRSRAQDLAGILNGIDTDVWNPSTDACLAKSYDAETFCEGKAACKTALQQQLNLPRNETVPLFGMVSRIADQKGFDLIAACVQDIEAMDLQMVVLGTGDPMYEQMLQDLARRFPDKVAAIVGFDDGLAHQIEAGADVYFMPSRYEPCGLNQMYSLRYGTIPIVHAVGGLADTVVDVTAKNIRDKTANGFLMDEYTPGALSRQIHRAIEAFQERPLWCQLVRTGMQQDWSWDRSALEYVQVYERVLRKHGIV